MTPSWHIKHYLIMDLRRLLYLILLSSGYIGCNPAQKKADFYSYTKTSDLWRFPLVEPYELISPTNSGDWFLVMKKPDFKNPDFFVSGDEFQFSNIESVGILDSVIVLHSTNIYWPKLSGSYNTTLIIDSRTEKKFIYSNEHHGRELDARFGELNIKSIKLYLLENVSKAFQANRTLPEDWR